MACRLLRKCSLCLSSSKQLRHSYICVNKLHTTHTEVTDVVISGGGMVGAAMACALGHEDMLQEKKVVLLEAAPEKEFHLSDKYSNRVCALSHKSVDLLNSFGAWDEILQMRCQPVKRMQVWESCSESLITFNRDDLTNDLAFIVENNVILEGITRRLRKVSDRVDVRYSSGAKCYKIPGRNMAAEENPDQSQLIAVELEDGSFLHTKLLIGADGFRSSVRQRADFHTVQWDYNQTAVVATLKLSDTENTVAWQRFLTTGPIAMLPLSSTLSSLIWTTTHENARHLMEIPEESFVDAINDAFWHDREKNSVVVNTEASYQNLLNAVIPGGVSSRQLPPTVIDIEEKSRAKFPLGLIHSSQYVRPRVALIGDAAHRIHPLAGQGVNLGFGDVAGLTEVLAKAIYNGSDIGSLRHLQEYETQRQREVVPVMATIDGLQKLYRTDLTPVVLARSLGLMTTNALKFVKDKIIQQASGGH